MYQIFNNKSIFCQLFKPNSNNVVGAEMFRKITLKF